MKEIMIVRHARSLFNVGDTKHLDAGLTDYGHKQAIMAGEFLKEEFGTDHWDIIITSPFDRCLKTSKGLGDNLECKISVDARLGEKTIDYHDLKSLVVPKRDDIFPEVDWSNYKDTDFAHERMDAYLGRLQSIWNFVSESDHEHVILVTHGSPAASFIDMHVNNNYNSIPLWDHSVNNCSMTWIKGKNMIWRTRELFWERG